MSEGVAAGTTAPGGEAESQGEPEAVKPEQVATVKFDPQTHQRVIKPIPDKSRAASGQDGIERKAAPPPKAGAGLPEPPKAEPDEEEPPQEEFEFGGTKFKSREQAEQSFRTLRGQFRSMQEKATAADGHDRKARGWYQEAMRLSAELEKARQGGAGAVQAEAKEAKQAAPEIDWALYAEIKKAADEAGKPYEAERWLLGEYEKMRQTARQAEFESLKSELLKSIEPLAQDHQLRGFEAQLESNIDRVTQLVDANGAPAYPEYDEPETAYEIGQLWHQAGLPAELAATPQGAILAVALYRHLKESAGPAATGEESVPGMGADVPEVGADESGMPAVSPRQLAAASMLAGGGARAERPDESIPQEVRKLFAGMKQDMADRSNLGFTR